MKSLLRLLVLISICLPTLAGPKGERATLAQFWSEYYAVKLARVESYDALVDSLSMRDRDRELALENGRRSKAPFVKPTIDVDGTKISLAFKKKKLIVDFREFREGRLFLNRREIHLDQKKTFVNYRSEALLEIMTMKTSSLFLDAIFPEAIATDPVDAETANYVANLFTSSSMAHNSLFGFSAGAPVFGDQKEPTIEEWLILGYVHEGKINQRLNADKHTDRFSGPSLSFTCQGSRLGALNIVNGEETEIFRVVGEGWQYQRPLGGIVQADSAGVVTGYSGEWGYESTLQSSNFPTGKSLFRLTNNRGLARKFDECCATTGCFQRVTNSYRAIEQRLQSDPRGRNSVQ